MQRIWNATLIMLVMSLSGLHVANADELPSIKQRVDQFNQERAKDTKGPVLTADEKALMSKSAESVANNLPEPGLEVGSMAPDFSLGNAYGKKINLYSQLRKGPVVLMFYRGAWCPYCNIQLHAMQESLPAFKKYNAQIIAVTPQQPDKSLEQVKKDKFPFEILSDVNDEVAKMYNLYFVVPAELHAFYKNKFKLDIEEYNGKGRTGLPVPGTFVISKSGEIIASFAEHDYMQRMEPAVILDALKSAR